MLKDWRAFSEENLRVELELALAHLAGGHADKTVFALARMHQQRLAGEAEGNAGLPGQRQGQRPAILAHHTGGGGDMAGLEDIGADTGAPIVKPQPAKVIAGEQKRRLEFGDLFNRGARSMEV